jgi:hypothetical protein
MYSLSFVKSPRAICALIQSSCFSVSVIVLRTVPLSSSGYIANNHTIGVNIAWNSHWNVDGMSHPASGAKNSARPFAVTRYRHRHRVQWLASYRLRLMTLRCGFE